MADGFITYSTKLDNSQLEKDLAKATKEVDKIEGQLQKNQDKRLPLSEQVDDLGVKLDNAKAKMAALQEEAKKVSSALASTATDPASVAAYADASIRKPVLDKELKAAEKVVDGLQGQFNRADAKLEALDKNTEKLKADLDTAKDKAGGIADKLSKGATAGEKMGDAIAHAEKKIGKFTHRVAQLAKRVFVFTLITQALRAIREHMGKYVMANSEASQAVARLKGALLTLAQPLLSVIIPAFTAFVNILTRVVSAVAGFVSMLFGKNINQTKKAAEGMYNEAEAIEAAGKAADKAAGSLAAFDEINQLSDDSTSGGAAGAAVPDFTFDTSSMQMDFEKLLGWIKLIGAALLAWKLSDSFLGGLKMFIGLIIAINGAIELLKGAWDAWQNGMNWDNLTQMLGGALLLAAGLGIAFGTVGAAIGLIAGGLVLLVSSFHDAMENGWSLENVLGSIAGLLMGGLGIALLTGSWIPLLIAGIASALLALTVATGHGEELIEGIRNICQGFVDFIVGIFTGDIERALGGVSKIFEGLRGVVDAVIKGVRDTFLGFLDWLDEITGGRFHGIIEVAKGFVSGFFESCRDILGDLLTAVEQIFGGIVKFIAGVFTNDWDMAWEGVKDIFKGCWNGIVSLLEGAVNFIIKGLNWLIKQMNKIRFTLPDWVPVVGGKSLGINIPTINPVSIPRLATGTVVPPNREFMALLGDNKTETEVVSPLSTMKQAMLEALQESGGMGGEIVLHVYLNGRKMAVELVKEINNMTREAGHSVVRT